MTDSKNETLQTEFEFTLPKGYVDAEGSRHQEGIMRLATAMDEIVPLRDARVKANPAYLSVVVLSRVILRLGSVTQITPIVIEALFAADLAYLQDFYRQVNSDGGARQLTVTCPQCEHVFQVEVTGPGGIVGYPLDSLYEEVAFIAYHFHWPMKDILHLEHADRQRFIDEISAINRQMNEPDNASPSKGIPLEVWAGLK